MDEKRFSIGRTAAFVLTAAMAWHEGWQTREVVWTFWLSSLATVLLHAVMIGRLLRASGMSSASWSRASIGAGLVVHVWIGIFLVVFLGFSASDPWMGIFLSAFSCPHFPRG